MAERIVVRLIVAALAVAVFALDYWAIRLWWHANPMFAAGAAVVAALIIFLPGPQGKEAE